MTTPNIMNKESMDKLSEKERLVVSMRAAASVFPYSETQLSSDEAEPVLDRIYGDEDIQPTDGDTFYSGSGSGCGAYETYMIDGTRYDIVTPDVSKDFAVVVRFDPIDWNARIAEVERSE